MVSRDGWPFPGHVATVTSTGINKTSLQRHPGVLASSYPIKGQARALKNGKQEKADEQQTTKNQPPSHQRRSTSQAISFVLSFFL
jgi:hypothetical protein